MTVLTAGDIKVIEAISPHWRKWRVNGEFDFYVKAPLAMVYEKGGLLPIWLHKRQQFSSLTVNPVPLVKLDSKKNTIVCAFGSYQTGIYEVDVADYSSALDTDETARWLVHFYRSLQGTPWDLS